MTRVVFLDPAEREMLWAANYYENKADGLGEEFLTEVRRTVTRIQERPKSGRVIRGRTRRRLLRRFPFGIMYCIEGEDIVVVAIMHLRRRPDYWKERI